MRSLVIYAFLTACFLFTTAEAAAQGVDLHTARLSASVHLEVGPSSLHGPAFGIGVEFWTPSGLFVARTAVARETWALIPNKAPVEKNYDLGLLYGWKAARKADAFFPQEMTLSLAVGLALTGFIRRGEQLGEGAPFVADRYEKLQEKTVGMPYEVRLTLGKKAGGGASLSFFGNRNHVDSYWGFLLGLFLGE